MSGPLLLEAAIQMSAKACPDQPARTWDLLRTALDEGLQSKEVERVEFFIDLDEPTIPAVAEA